MNKLKKGLIIVDFDGTLYNTAKANREAYNEALREYGYVIDMKLFQKLYTGMHYLDFLPEIVDSSSMVEKVHNKKVEVYKNYYDSIEENTVLYDLLTGVKEEYYLVILTNASRNNCIGVLRYFGKESFFDDIVTGDDVENRKPHNEGINKILKKFQISEKNTLLIEDDVSNVNIPTIKSLVLYNFS